MLTHPKPEVSPHTPSIYSLTSSLFIDLWDVHDAKAHGIITDHICNHLVLATAAKTSTAKLYEKLVDIHQNQNVRVSTFYTFIGMLETKWDGSPDNIQDHITTFATGNSKLVAMKKLMDSEFLAFLLLHSLPTDPIWEMFKTSVLNSMPKDAKITFSDISDHLGFNAMHQQGMESALKAKSFKPKGTQSDVTSSLRSQAGKPYCSLHKMNSHDTKDCFTLKKKEREDKEKGKEQANKSSHEGGSSLSSDLEMDSKAEWSNAASTYNLKVSKDLMTHIQADIRCESSPTERITLHTVIVLDSGTSTHMTLWKDWFIPDSFKWIHLPCLIHFGDKSTVPATGIGHIILHQTIKGEALEIDVQNVLFVPLLTLMLLSVRHFNKSRFFSTFTSVN